MLRLRSDYCQSLPSDPPGLIQDRRYLVLLDSVIATMRQTGADMQSKYRNELGGLAVNFVEC
jgi:L-serine dehydratase